MTERATELGGWCTNEDSPTGGTRVKAWLPILIEDSAGGCDKCPACVTSVASFRRNSAIASKKVVCPHRQLVADRRQEAWVGCGYAWSVQVSRPRPHLPAPGGQWWSSSMCSTSR